MRGFTLMEALTVVALLAMAASMGAVSLSGTAAAADVQRAVSVVREADARGRLLARSDGPCALETSKERDRLRLVVAGEPPREHRMPAPIRVHLIDGADAPAALVEIDARGRSIDYAAIIEHASGASTLRFAGLTGWSAMEAQTP